MKAAQHPRRSALLIAALSLAGKCLAIGKTLIIASLFGTSSALDAFWVAYSLPVLLPGLFTNTLTVAFVPRFVAGLDGRVGAQAWRGANTLFTLVLAVSIVGSIAMYTFSSVIVRTLAPGLDTDAHALAVALSRLMLPCVALLTCSSLLSALSYARERFALPTLEGVISNIAIISVALLWARNAGVYALTAGVIVGFCAQALLLIIGNRDLIRTSLRPAFDFTHADLRAPLAHLLPLFVGSAGAMLSGLVDQYFVSKLDAGSISALSFAWMFAMLPVEIFAQAVLTSYYPALARQFAQRDLAASAETYAQGTRFLLALTLPCAIMLALLAQPLVVLLLQRGSFDAHSTALTAQAMGVLALGVVTRAHAYFSYRVLHAALHPWTQIAIGLAGVASCIGLNVLWAQRLGLPGIVLSTVLSSLQSALLATWAVHRMLDRPMPVRFRSDIRCLLLSGGVLALGLWMGQAFVPESLYLSAPKLWAFVSVLCAFPALAAAIFCAWHLGQSELREAGSAIARRWQRMAA